MLKVSPRPHAAAFERPAPTSSAQAVLGGLQVRVHEDLAAIEPTWRDLERRGHATGFQRFDWVSLIAQRLAGERRARLLIAEVTDGMGRTVMILPLALERRGGVTEIGCLDLDVCDYAAPVLSPDHIVSPGAMRALWAELRRALPRADLLRLAKIPRRVGGAVNPLLHLPGCRTIVSRCYGLPISPPREDLIQRVTRPSTFRDFGKFQRRLERRGTVEFTLASIPAEVDAIASALIEQRQARFAEMGRYNLLDRPEIAAFYRTAAHDGLDGGPVRLFGLSVDGEWIATAYGLEHGGEFCLLIQTMAGGEWRNCSPGIMISARAMEWAAAAGLSYFDFSIGFLPYKTELGGQEGDLSECAEVLSPLGAAILGRDRLAEWSKAELKRHPATFERLRALRRSLRRL